MKSNVLIPLAALCGMLLVAVFVFFDKQDAWAVRAWDARQPALALALGGGNAQTAMQLGRYYFNGGAYDLEKARRAYEQALVFDPNISPAHYQLGRIYFVEGKFDLALRELEKELEKNTWNQRTHYMVGLVYAYRDRPGDLERSEEAFRKFIEWAPKEWGGYNDLAWILLRQEKYDETKELIEKAWTEIPETRENNPWLMNAYGVAELNLGNKQSARSHFLKTQEILEDMSLAAWHRAYPGNASEDARAGLEAFKEAVARNISKTE